MAVHYISVDEICMLHRYLAMRQSEFAAWSISSTVVVVDYWKFMGTSECSTI